MANGGGIFVGIFLMLLGLALYAFSFSYPEPGARSAFGFVIMLAGIIVIIYSIVGGAPFFAYSGSYTNCYLLGFGASVEMMYYNGAWWVVSQNGCQFS